MGMLIGQFEVLAQGSGLDEWGDILVFVVMAILWLVGGLAKAMSSKKTPEQRRRQEPAAGQRQGNRRETWQDRLARKAQEIQRAAQAKARQLEQQARPHGSTEASSAEPGPPQPPAGRITIRRGSQGDSVMVYERPPSQPQPVRKTPRHKNTLAAQRIAEPRSVKPAISQAVNTSLPVVRRESPQPPDVQTGAPSGRPASLQSSDIIDYSDPDALKKAILHYEVLGKPLALRESSEGQSAF